MKTTFTKFLKSIKPLLLLYFLFAFSSAQAQYKYDFQSKISGVLLPDPLSVAIDDLDQFYAIDGNSVRKISADGKLVLVFGGIGSEIGRFNNPTDIVLDIEGNIYVADKDNHRIQVFDSEGAPIRQFGKSGNKHGEFRFPSGLAFDNEGNLYVADKSNARIQVFEKDGTFIRQISKSGSGENDLRGPRAITLDQNRNIYVVDEGSYGSVARVKIFQPDGTLIREFGSPGTSNGQFKDPWGIALDKAGNIYVADRGNARIQVFTTNGTFIKQMYDIYSKPTDIIIDTKNYIYIADTEYGLRKFSSTAGYHSTIGGFKDRSGLFYKPSSLALDPNENLLASDGASWRVYSFLKDNRYNGIQYGGNCSTCTGTGEFKNPGGIAFDQPGNMYLVDNGNERIQVYKDGVHIKQIGESGRLSNPKDVAIANNGDIYVSSPFNGIVIYSSYGTYKNTIASFGDSKITYAWGLAIGKGGEIYAVDNVEHQIKVLNSDGTLLRKFGGLGNGIGQFDNPTGIALDSDDNIYVADTDNHRIQVFKSDGTFIRQFGSVGASDGQFQFPKDVTVDKTGTVYVADSENGFIKKFKLVAIPKLDVTVAPFFSNDEVINIQSGGTYDFDNIDERRDKIIVKNLGAATLSISDVNNIEIIGANASDFRVNSYLQSNILPGSSAFFYINFSPSGAGLRTAQLLIRNNDPDRNPFIINIRGTGKETATLDFPSITKTFGDNTFLLEASTNSTNEISYSIEEQNTIAYPGIITLVGREVKIIKAGRVKLRAFVADDESYSSTTKSSELLINKAEATLTVSNLEQQYDGQTKQVTVVTAPQELAVKVTYNDFETLPVAAGTYNVLVTVVDDNYVGSATATLNILNSTAIADVKKTQAAATLYPNPTVDGKVAIDGLKQSEKVQVTVTDAAGRKVWQTKATTNGNGTVLLDMENKTTIGLYFIQVSDAQGEPTVLKLIKK